MITLINPFFVLFIFLIIVLFVYPKKKNRHQRNILKSSKILKKINSFKYPGQKLNYLRKIDPFVFEELLLTCFELKGFKVVRNKKYTGDGGIDGVIFDNKKQKILIQAKRYSNYISKQDLVKFKILVNQYNCKGYFIHTGKTSKNNLKQTLNNQIEIYSGSKLLELLK